MNFVVTLLVGMLFIRPTDSFSQQGCGEVATRTRGKIYGGKHSRLGMWPWHVGIHKQSISEYHISCGGALIAPQWVLTGAHCFYESRTNGSKIWYEEDITSLKKYKVIAGDINTQIREISEQERFPIEVYIHPGYRDSPYYDNDIALVKLNQKVTLSSLVRTVCLPISNVDLAKSGTVGTVARWGKTKTSEISTVLFHTTLKIQNNTVCDQATHYFFNRAVTFCAGDGKGNKDSCSGDSGGSLVRSVVINGKRRWVTVGLVSWGEGCAIKDKYGYYTRIHSFVDWIKDTINYSQITCPDPGQPHNGVRRPSRGSYSYKANIRFYCNRNHVMVGQSSLTCQIDGTWNGYPSFCLAPCQDPGVPKNGLRLGDMNFNHGKTVIFVCEKNFKRVGLSMITCLNGTWNGDAPKCYNTNCRNPGTPANGQRHGNLFSHLQNVRFSCDKEFIMVGASSIQCRDGSWTSNKPVCAECGSPLGMENRKIPDRNIQASSRWSLRYYADHGRLNGGSAWCSDLGDRKPYLEIDLDKPFKITYLATQGGGGKWVSKYIVSHNLARSSFIEYREGVKEVLFTGNTDATSIVKHKLKKPFIARKIKFHPIGVTLYGRAFNSACMRVEIYGCDLPNDCVMVGSRVLGNWQNNYRGGYNYYKAIVRTIGRYNVQLELEDENHHDDFLKKISKTNIVLDVPNKQLHLPSGTRVLMPYHNKYYTGTIGSTFHQDFYQVYPDYSKSRFVWRGKKTMRVLKREQFCE